MRDSIRQNNAIYGQIISNIEQLEELGVPYEQYKIVFLEDRPGAPPRTYNKPKCAEVAVLSSSDFDSTTQNYRRSVVVSFENNGRLQEIPFSHPAYFPLCYPLFYFQGEQGWHINMKSDSNVSKKITIREYGSYLLQIRDPINVKTMNDFADNEKIKYDTVLCGNTLTQQFVNDLYISVENERLQYLRLNQKKLKVEFYQGLIDAFATQEQRLAGKYVILPATHVGSPRWYYSEYQDAMARQRVLGKPELFITFTCNPNWPEIKEAMKGFESGTNSRPDIIARAFEMRLQTLMKCLTEYQGFGVDTGYMYTMEWQKRGLPHAHILIFLRKEDKIIDVEDIDKVVCAEFPNPESNPRLFDLVTTHMVHGPCGKYNAKSPCCDAEGECSKHFPYDLQSKTQMTGEGYPNYRRRGVHEGGHVYKYQKSKNVDPIILDNGWVVPYNPFLLKLFEAHINVEICSTVKAVKYLHKYVFKGSDKAQIEVVRTNHTGLQT